MHGTIHALVIRARWIESHQDEVVITIAEAVLQHPSRTPSQTRPTHGFRMRRKEYARIHQLWESDMTKTVKLVLDRDVRATVPSMEKMVDFWTPILTT